MEVIGSVTSVIAVIQPTEHVFNICGQYASSVKHAKIDIEHLQREVEIASDILNEVYSIVKKDQLQGVQATAAFSNGSLREYEATLLDLRTQPKPLKKKNAMSQLGLRALKRPFTSGDMEKALPTLERHKTAIVTGLSTISTRLTMDIKNEFEVIYMFRITFDVA
jgi:hypothetical protein